MNPIQLAIYLTTFLVGVAAGFMLLWFYYRLKKGGFDRIASDILHRAELDADTMKKAQELLSKQQQLDQQREMEQFWQGEKRKVQKEEERLKQREDKLEGRMHLVEKKLSDIEKREAILIARKGQLDEEKKGVGEIQLQLLGQLERLSGLSASEAKELILAKISSEVKTDAAHLIRRTIKEAEEQAEQQSRRILATAINRLAAPCVSEATVNTVAIPNEEMKGRIIGREGRNIRTLERLTGVNFVIDETPGAIVLSGFDPVRMQVAKLAVTELVQDGRIHPTRIEEVVEKAQGQVQKLIRQHGEDAALRAGAINIHPDLIGLLGRLKFRFSYGQNVLDHSLEVSYLLGMMAAELGLDVRMARRIGLLHDIGKAVTHEIEGSHAVIGHDLALKFGESREVANGIGCHHHEMDPITVEGSLCSAADAISASRQGARSEPVEEYIKRLKKLEEIAMEFEGVEKAYAMQAGREIRAVVLPDILDDTATVHLARDLAKRIENELSYPGKIKITIIREKRAVQYAL